MWFKKHDTNTNALGSAEYELCLKRIAELSGKFELLTAKVEGYKMQLDNLRGNFSRKLKGMSEEEEKVAPKEEVEKKTKTETIIKDEFVCMG